MSFIALFMPTSISLLIRNKRRGKKADLPEMILEYAVLVVMNVFITMAVIIYVLGMGDVEAQAFNSFPFFTKYLLIACVIAWLTPYVEEILCKFIGVSFTVEKRETVDTSKEIRKVNTDEKRKEQEKKEKLHN